MNHEVFISFSFKDQNIAEKLVNILTSRYGITCWICTRELEGGSLYKAEIPDAIDTAKVVVFMQSKNSIESREVPKKIGIAFDMEKTIIPFRLDETPLKAELRYDLYGIEYIDATIYMKPFRLEILSFFVEWVALGNPSLQSSTPGNIELIMNVSCLAGTMAVLHHCLPMILYSMSKALSDS